MFRKIDEHAAAKKSKKEYSDKDLKKDVALKLKLYKEKHNYTQDDIATMLGVSRRQIGRWERQEVKPNTIALKFMEEKGIL